LSGKGQKNCLHEVRNKILQRSIKDSFAGLFVFYKNNISIERSELYEKNSS